MPRFPQMMALSDVALHDVAQELLEDLRIALAQVARKSPVIQISGERSGVSFSRSVSQIFRI